MQGSFNHHRTGPRGFIPRRGRLGAGAAALLAVCGWTASAASPADLTVCFDKADQSPYLYVDEQGVWRGAALDLARAAMEQAGLRVEWLPRPWLRCLQEVSDPEPGQGIRLALYGSLSLERSKVFLASLPLHLVQGGVWYSRRKFAAAPLEQMTDLVNYRLCGVHGHNYSWLQEFTSAKVDAGAFTLSAALQKLKLGRCDLLLSSKEHVEGAERMQQLEIGPDLIFAAYPGRPPLPQHLLLPRNRPESLDLKARIDRSLKLLHRNGSADHIYERYLPGGTGLARMP